MPWFMIDVGNTMIEVQAPRPTTASFVEPRPICMTTGQRFFRRTKDRSERRVLDKRARNVLKGIAKSPKDPEGSLLIARLLA